MLKRTVLGHYISKEILISLFAVYIVLLLIIVSSTLAKLLGKAAEGSLPNDVIWVLLAISTARYTIQLIPLSLFLGILFAFGRLYKDSEIAAMHACGVDYKRFYRPLLVILFPICILSGVLNLYSVPWLVKYNQSIEDEAGNRADLSGLIAGRFNETRGKDKAVFFMDREDKKGKLHNVFLQQQRYKSTDEAVEVSPRANYKLDKNGRKFLIFENGKRFEGKPGDKQYRVLEYETHGVYIEEPTPVRARTKRNAIPTNELFGSDKLSHQTELQWRFSLPILVMVLSLLAVPLSYASPRQGRFSKIALAIFIYLLYTNLLVVASTWMERSQTPQWLGLWWVHIIFVVLILFLLARRTSWHKLIFSRDA